MLTQLDRDLLINRRSFLCFCVASRAVERRALKVLATFPLLASLEGRCERATEMSPLPVGGAESALVYLLPSGRIRCLY